MFFQLPRQVDDDRIVGVARRLQPLVGVGVDDVQARVGERALVQRQQRAEVENSLVIAGSRSTRVISCTVG